MVKDIFEEALENLDQREKDIVLRKFGLLNEKETLDEIGQDYNICRERVRQIQNRAIRKLRLNLENSKRFNSLLEKTKIFLQPLGVKREEIFLNLIKEKLNFLEEEIRVLKFLIDISMKISRHEEDENFYTFYAENEETLETARHTLKRIHFHFLEKHKNCHPEEVVFKITLSEIKRHLKKYPYREDLFDFLKILKLVAKNPYGFWGIKTHPEISPPGLKEKIYLILKIERRPLHFSYILEKLNEFRKLEDGLLHPSWKKEYDAKSIKNELIRNPKFILVGRGTYALKEWNLIPGTAKELILKFIQKNKKISVENLWHIISQHRNIKRATFLIYLKELENRIKREGNFLIYNG